MHHGYQTHFPLQSLSTSSDATSLPISLSFRRSDAGSPEQSLPAIHPLYHGSPTEPSGGSHPFHPASPLLMDRPVHWSPGKPSTEADAADQCRPNVLPPPYSAVSSAFDAAAAEPNIQPPYSPAPPECNFYSVPQLSPSQEPAHLLPSSTQNNLDSCIDHSTQLEVPPSHQRPEISSICSQSQPPVPNSCYSHVLASNDGVEEGVNNPAFTP
ncbi:unnamed protein product [Protopolystoma xenopodis]|uniref:Uncharacterized protein n=1 Tax=Protopolystoma xenopodis TaxID=117903 RepID=A0A3S5B4T9_9PLAT|nr:unnamed protein product [Protopolystoma xenopodis]